MFEAVSYDKVVDAVYQKVPESKRKNIEDRDRPKSEKAQLTYHSAPVNSSTSF